MAEVLGPHGIKGWVKLRPWLEDPTLLVGQKNLVMAPGPRMRPEPVLPLKVLQVRRQGRGWVMQISGVSDRDAAEALRG